MLETGTVWTTLDVEFQTVQNSIEDVLNEISEKMNNMDETGRQKAIKLPTLEIPKFGGSFREWRPFIQLFNSLVHENQTISRIEKMNYLQSHLVGEARDMMKHFITINCSDNFDALRSINR